jgi:dTDP-4-dehydrorhamnose 3,5-epimerase-like enzyme
MATPISNPWRDNPNVYNLHDQNISDGVVVHQLSAIADERGHLTEVFRQTWFPEAQPVQWNFVQSRQRVLRGFHVH